MQSSNTFLVVPLGANCGLPGAPIIGLTATYSGSGSFAVDAHSRVSVSSLLGDGDPSKQPFRALCVCVGARPFAADDSASAGGSSSAAGAVALSTAVRYTGAGVATLSSARGGTDAGAAAVGTAGGNTEAGTAAHSPAGGGTEDRAADDAATYYSSRQWVPISNIKPLHELVQSCRMQSHQAPPAWLAHWLIPLVPTPSITTPAEAAAPSAATATSIRSLFWLAVMRWC